MSIPPLSDHAFMRQLREDVSHIDTPMTAIAAKYGMEVDDLCRWIMAYKEPKKKPYLNRDTAPAPITYGGKPLRDMEEYDEARRFAAWRKSQTGAAETRRMLEAGK